MFTREHVREAGGISAKADEPPCRTLQREKRSDHCDEVDDLLVGARATRGIPQWSINMPDSLSITQVLPII